MNEVRRPRSSSFLVVDRNLTVCGAARYALFKMHRPCGTGHRACGTGRDTRLRRPHEAEVSGRVLVLLAFTEADG